jgi:prepilin-type N-terminal cleavage/methylation domain-containing protein
MYQEVSMRTRGFTLLEVSIAFGLLAIAIMMTSLLVSGLERHQRALWEDAIAESLAVSTLEKTIAEAKLDPTLAEGREILVEKAPSGVQILPDVKSVLFIHSIPEEKGIVELQVQVSWTFSELVPNGQTRTLTRTLRWRNSK